MPLPPGLVERWTAEQRELAARRIERPLDPLPRYIAGADCAFPDKHTARAAAVVYDRETQQILEQTALELPVEVPYISGYLSFREGPALLAVLARLRHPWHALLLDGQGTAHPRRCGIAVHVGVILGIPTIGVAKSILVGTHPPLADLKGSTAPLTHKRDVVGTALRTRDRVSPLFISPGHLTDPPTATALTLACTTRYRLPEPTRLADKLTKQR